MQNSNNGFATFIKNLVSGDWTFITKGIDTFHHGLAALVRSFVSIGQNSVWYFLIFSALLIAFAYFYIAISFNPVEVANNIKNNGGAIPGIRSGRPTVDFIKKVLNRITLLGALLIAVIACIPLLAGLICTIFALGNPGSLFANAFGMIGGFVAFGGSSLMIVVGVALETTRELEAQMSLRNYKGFLD
jgi:preprotein translocase subunit SecY